MPEFEVTSPDGQKFRVNAPDGATQEEALAFAQSQHAKSAGPPSTPAVALNALPKAAAGFVDQFTNAPTRLHNLTKAAYGAAAYALGYKDVGDSVTMSEEPDFAHRALSSVGAISPDREPQTPGQRLVDAAVQGGATFLASPAAGVKQIMKNVALGATSGTAGEVTKEVSGSPTAAIAVSMLTPLAVRHAISGIGKGTTNEVVGETIKDGMDAGYVVPPSSIKPVLVRDKIESFGGKAAVKQEAALRNQEVTNDLAARAVNLPKGTALTPGKLDEVREKAGAVYGEAAQLRPTPDMPWFKRYHDTDIVEQLKQARADANAAWKHYERSADPSVKDRAEAFGKQAASLEKDLENLATANKRPDIVKRLVEARTIIAKTYDVERALNVGNGNVDAHVIGQLLQSGKPLTGELKLIGRFSLAFGHVTREGGKVPSPNVSALDPMASAALSMGGYAATGGVGGAATAGSLPLLRGPARRYLLSKGVQDRLMKNPPKLDETMLRSILAGRSISEGE